MKLYLTVLITIFSQIALAQNGWNWPEDSIQARRKVSIYPELIESGNYDIAKEKLDWLLENAPNLNVSIYINGVKLYDSLISQESDSEKRNLYKQKILDLYDQRIKYYGNQKSVQIRKAFAAYRLLKDNNEQLALIKRISDDAVISNKGDVPDGLFLIQADLTRRQYKSKQLIDSDEILMRFDSLLDFYSINKSKNEQTENKLYAMLISTVSLDCTTLENWLMPRLIDSPDDTTLAKRIVSLSFSTECTNDKFFITAVEILAQISPSYGLLKLLGGRKEANEEHDAAVDYYLKALELASDNEQAFDIKMRMARFYQRIDNYGLARRYAAESAALKKSESSPHELIGDLWYGSFKKCKEGKSIVTDRGVYLAAYKSYERAGNQDKMMLAAQQFPTIEEIFGELKKEGEELLLTNCWSQEKVTIKRRIDVNQ